MPGSRLPRFSASAADSDSWWTRVRENLAHYIAPPGLSPTAANGAPIHLLKFARTRTATRAQTISAITHACIFAALVLLAVQRPGHEKSDTSAGMKGPTVVAFRKGILNIFGPHASPGSGRGGDRNPIPATRSPLPPLSSIQLIKPTLPQNQRPEFPVPPTLFDTNAPPVLISIDKIGLPWMPNDTNSPGPGKGHGIGSADGNTMGDSGNGQAGYGEAGPYAPGTILPTCAYCPLPGYTDEARHVKMQGTVTLRVLVGADGRASDIRVIRGVGYGLDDRAMQTVRTWRFTPARDANHRAVAAWITVEAIFHLF